VKPLRPITPDELVAVTIATKNRPAYLAMLLATLAQQTYRRWILVVNDQSDEPVAEHAAVKDVLTLIETQGRPVTVIRTTNPTDRYQRVLDAVPPDVEFVHRIDDDVVVSPDYLEKLVRPFAFFPDRPVAAVGGCLPAPNMQPMGLSDALRQPGWFPRVDRPTWRLQGHFYREREVLEMESLWGCAMCYRRTAVEDVGGWVVEGQSQQIFREDSDMSARLVVAGYELMMTTEALGWHLVAPTGGARVVEKTAHGNLFTSHREEYDADDRLFRDRLAALLAGGYRRDRFERFRIDELATGARDARPLLGLRDRVYHDVASRLPAPLARQARRLRRALRRR
jgi:GT2 family glycosyltransferase